MSMRTVNVCNPLVLLIDFYENFWEYEMTMSTRRANDKGGREGGGKRPKATPGSRCVLVLELQQFIALV